MNVELVRAWPRRFERRVLDLAPGCTVADALRQAGWGDDAEVTGYAVFGEPVTPETALREGDRLELLRGLQADPKDARRRRAERAKRSG